MMVSKLALFAAFGLAFATPVFAQTTPPVTPPVTSPTIVAPSPQSMPMPDMFMANMPTNTLWRSSEMVGQAVYNKADERLGDIEELLIDKDGKVIAAVIGVGGFLGMGETKVAIAYSYYRMSLDSAGKNRLVVDVDKKTLAAAPTYKATESMKRT